MHTGDCSQESVDVNELFPLHLLFSFSGVILSPVQALHVACLIVTVVSNLYNSLPFYFSCVLDVLCTDMSVSTGMW